MVVRRHVPELAALEGKAAHQPGQRDAPSYPTPMIDHAEAVQRFRNRPAKNRSVAEAFDETRSDVAPKVVPTGGTSQPNGGMKTQTVAQPVEGSY